MSDTDYKTVCRAIDKVAESFENLCIEKCKKSLHDERHFMVHQVEDGLSVIVAHYPEKSTTRTPRSAM